MENKFVDLKNEVRFRNHLLRNRMIKDYVAFDKGYNVVALEFGGVIHYANMRIMGDDKNLRFSIYCGDQDYIEEEPPFKCIGSYNKILDRINIEQMDFSIGCCHSATIGDYSDPSKYEISTRTSTGDFISTLDRQKMFAEFLGAQRNGGNAVEEFYDKYSDEYELFPMVISQRFTFDKSPTAKLKNFSDGYKLVWNMFENNSEFDDDKLDEDSVFPTILATKNGVDAMKKLGAHSVKSECQLYLTNFFSDLMDINLYSSAHRFIVDQKDDKEYTLGYLDNLDIKYPDELKQMHYDLSSSMPRMFNIDAFERITGLAKSSGAEKVMNYLGAHNLNLRLNALSNSIYYGKDTKIKGIDPEDMQM